VLVVFRADASKIIGSGHIMRCLTLAERLRESGAQCIFVCRAHDGDLRHLIGQRGFTFHMLPLKMKSDVHLSDEFLGTDVTKISHSAWLGADWVTDANQTMACLGSAKVDWLVVDHYAIDHRWESEMRAIGEQIMVIDDIADRKHDCDVLLDQNWFGEEAIYRYENLVPNSCTTYLGPKFSILSKEYAALRKSMPARNGVVRRVLVFMGGSDPHNQTELVLNALLLPEFANLIVDVVIDSNHPAPDRINDLVTMRPMTTLYQGLPTLSDLMITADLMISAGGSTSWERMCLGLPAIVISIANNQTATNIAMMKSGLINFLGEWTTVTIKDIQQALLQSLSQPDKLRKQSLQMQTIVNGGGVDQIVARLSPKSQCI